jgi:hypothetical protein
VKNSITWFFKNRSFATDFLNVRGAKQLSWNYNYGALSAAIFGDSQVSKQSYLSDQLI